MAAHTLSEARCGKPASTVWIFTYISRSKGDQLSRQKTDACGGTEQAHAMLRYVCADDGPGVRIRSRIRRRSVVQNVRASSNWSTRSSAILTGVCAPRQALLAGDELFYARQNANGAQRRRCITGPCSVDALPRGTCATSIAQTMAVADAFWTVPRCAAGANE